VIRSFVLTNAAPYDNQPVAELLDSFRHQFKDLLGDGAYNDEQLQAYLKQYRDLNLLAPTKKNQRPARTTFQQKGLNALRLIAETVNAQLQEQFHLSKHDAKSTWGFIARIAAKVTAHSVGMMVKKIWGLPLLR
jgi:hypothetical protein